jgi:hypothetical protein
MNAPLFLNLNPNLLHWLVSGSTLACQRRTARADQCFEED